MIILRRKRLGATGAGAATAPCAPSLSRREAERIAVDEVVAELFGPGARLERRPCGRPHLPGFSGCISVSHCADELVVAVNTRGPVGVDVELWRPALRRTFTRWLTPAEQQALDGTDASLLRAWTAKEAIFKALPEAQQPAGLMDVPLPHPGFAVSFTMDDDGHRCTALALPLT